MTDRCQAGTVLQQQVLLQQQVPGVVATAGKCFVLPLLLLLLLRDPQQQQHQQEGVLQSKQKPSDRAVSGALCGYEQVCMPHGPDEVGPRNPEGNIRRKIINTVEKACQHAPFSTALHMGRPVGGPSNPRAGHGICGPAHIVPGSHGPRCQCRGPGRTQRRRLKTCWAGPGWALKCWKVMARARPTARPLNI